MRSLLILAVASAPLLAASSDPGKRLDQSAEVFSEVMQTPDKGIPHNLLQKAQCIVILPALKKGAFIVGGEYGRGVVSCRNGDTGAWSAPGNISMEGGSVGFQIGGSETDVILLFMNKNAANKMLSTDFTLGAEGEAAAGPVGRTASADTDAVMRAEVLSWSRSRGAFAGVALKGATLRQDMKDNEALYGKKLTNREIVTSNVAAPAAASRLMTELNRYPASTASN